MASKVAKLNDDLKKLCEENLIDYINNGNIDESCLGIKQLHLNKKGNAIFAKNINKLYKLFKISMR